MKTRELQFRQLTADVGKMLTKAQVEDENYRTFADTVVLGAGESESDYVEWTVAQVKAWEDEHKQTEVSDGDELKGERKI